MRGSNQGGSLAGFIVIGAFLVLVLAGGLYGLNRYNTEQQKKQEIAQNGEDQPSSTEEKQASPETKTESSSGTDTSSNKDTSGAGTGNSSSQSQAQNTGQSSPSQQGANQLPHTGPADGLLHAVAVILLAFATASYLQSRAYARQQSLR